MLFRSAKLRGSRRHGFSWYQDEETGIWVERGSRLGLRNEWKTEMGCGDYLISMSMTWPSWGDTGHPRWIWNGIPQDRSMWIPWTLREWHGDGVGADIVAEFAGDLEAMLAHATWFWISQPA